jgi:hypothetical protein
MSAFVLNWLVESQRLSIRKIMLGIWLVFFPKSFEPLFAIKRIFLSKSGQFLSGEKAGSVEDEDLKKQIGVWIRDNTHPQEKVFVAGYGAQIQAYSERLSPSIYFNVTQTDFAKNRLYADLSSGRPALIVIPKQERYLNSVDADIRSFIARLALNNYHLDTCLYNYNIYRYSKANNFR